MKKVLIIMLTVLLTLTMIGCGDESSGIDWYNKIQKESVAESYIEEVSFNTNIAILHNELNALLTVTMGLREGLFDFSEEDFNKSMDDHVYYSDVVRFSKVCKDMGIDIKIYLEED